MRNVININKNWLFVKDTVDVNANAGEVINLPHSWNAIDGQDGGNDYFRGTCYYAKSFKKSELESVDKFMLIPVIIN